MKRPERQTDSSVSSTAEIKIAWVNRIDKERIMLNPLKPKPVCIIFKNPVRIAKKTPHFTITKINWFSLFKERVAVYSENLTKPVNTK
jgi:hypothetical protein